MGKTPYNQSSGLYCSTCDAFHEWNELKWEATGRDWKWICPWCREILRVDVYLPPPDLPDWEESRWNLESSTESPVGDTALQPALSTSLPM